MKNFAAQQLTKSQMNKVSGGIGLWHCTWAGGENYFTAQEAVKFVADWKANNSGATPNCSYGIY